MTEKIRVEVSSYKFRNDCAITISIGVKQYKDKSVETLVKNADELLYMAKRKGRNRVEGLY